MTFSDSSNSLEFYYNSFLADFYVPEIVITVILDKKNNISFIFKKSAKFNLNVLALTKTALKNRLQTEEINFVYTNFLILITQSNVKTFMFVIGKIRAIFEVLMNRFCF